VSCAADPNGTVFGTNALATTCAGASLVFEDECTVTCLVGWSPGGLRTTVGNPVTYECTVQDGVADLFPVGGACKEMECVPPLTAFDGSAPSLSCAAITDAGTENLPHGESCTLTCPSGFKAVDGSPAIACDKGILRGCSDASCAEESLTDSVPHCVPADKTFKMVEAISTGVVATTVGANFLAAKEALAMQKFKEAVHTHIILKSEEESTVAIAALEITELAPEPPEDARRVQDNATDANNTGTTEAPPTLAPAQRTSKVYAPTLVVPASEGDPDDPTTGFGAVFEVFQKLATQPSGAEEFRTGLQAALLNSFPMTVVEAVVIEAPRLTKIYVEVPAAPAPAPTPAPTAAAAESGGWGLYILVAVVFVAALGGGGYYYTQVFLPQQKAKEAAAAGEVDPLTGAPMAAETSGERSMV
jgi:hypothetical protein